jgi:hypothetical protein
VLVGCAASNSQSDDVAQVEVAPPPAMDAVSADRFARLALGCVHRRYPNKVAHVMRSDEDALPPWQLTPAFYGCFDWHSAVHGHWMLVRLLRRFGGAAFEPDARAALAQSLTSEHLASEVVYVGREDRSGFERPYGLAWLLQLAADLRDWSDPDAQAWGDALKPLEIVASRRLQAWLPKLTHPIRSGEHSQTAFALGLAIDWARSAKDTKAESVFVAQTKRLYGDDRACPLSYEPSGQDFLSPCLAEADLMRRVMSPEEFATWLEGFLPDIPKNGAVFIEPVVPTDRADGKLVHLDGLNLSRAWMLAGIVDGLPPEDARIPALRNASNRHANAGLEAVSGEHYAGGHWLASFATYLMTRGEPAVPAAAQEPGVEEPAASDEPAPAPAPAPAPG